MPQVIEKQSIKIGKEPMVLLPLKQWQIIEESLEDKECLLKYQKAVRDPKNKKLIPFEGVKKTLNLP